VRAPHYQGGFDSCWQLDVRSDTAFPIRDKLAPLCTMNDLLCPHTVRRALHAPTPIAQLLYDLQIVATPCQSPTLTDCGVGPLMFVTPGLPLGMLEIEPDCRCRNPILASGDMHELWLQLVPKKERAGPNGG
jgi:hypothetical protein